MKSLLDGLKLLSIFTANFTITILLPLLMARLLGVALGAI